MRLMRDRTPRGYMIDIFCRKCGAQTRLADAFADRAGPSYRAYYCPDCAVDVFGGDAVEKVEDVTWHGKIPW